MAEKMWLCARHTTADRVGPGPENFNRPCVFKSAYQTLDECEWVEGWFVASGDDPVLSRLDLAERVRWAVHHTFAAGASEVRIEKLTRRIIAALGVGDDDE